ncbi:MAG: phage portal protein, partial [Armatimonadota bacterium]
MSKYEIRALSWQEFEHKTTRTASLLVPEYSADTSQGRPRPESYEDYAQVYGDVAWVYRCIARIAHTCASVPLEVYRRGSGGEAQRGHDAVSAELEALLEFANEFEALPDLVEQTATYLNLTGNAFWGIERDERDRPAELWCLRPDRVRIKPDRKRYIAGYVYEVGGRRIDYDTRDMVHIKYLSPADDYYGMGPLR